MAAVYSTWAGGVSFFIFVYFYVDTVMSRNAGLLLLLNVKKNVKTGHVPMSAGDRSPSGLK